MKLLFDQNLSHRLKDLLHESFPDSKHVKDLEMERASDTEIWEYAASNGYTIVSKDSDFHQRSFVYGSPPKIIWIQRGNCTTDEIGDLIRKKENEIKAFGQNPNSSFLILE